MSANFIDLTGCKFGNLKVIARGDNRKTGRSAHTTWIVECLICKQIRPTPVLGHMLRSGRQFKSCGCLRRHGQGRKIRYLWTHYKYGAIRRKLAFDLSEEFFSKMVLLNCTYCGKPPSPVNGIDRQNASMGYIESNCTAACTRCNYAKGRMSQKEFFDMIDEIWRYRNGSV